jgi:hypothetical protein
MLTVSMVAPTTGWVAVGFDPTAAMKDANLIIGYVTAGDDGELFIRDDWGNGHTSHVADVDEGGSSDVTNAEGSEVDGITTVSFSIPLDSGDEFDVPLNTGEEHKVLFAYGHDNADDFTSYHSWAKLLEVEF